MWNRALFVEACRQAYFPIIADEIEVDETVDCLEKAQYLLKQARIDREYRIEILKIYAMLRRQSKILAKNHPRK